MVTHIEKQWKPGAVIQLFYSMHFNIRKKTRLVFLAVWLSCRSSGKQFPSHRTSLQGDRYWMAPTTGDKPVRTLVRLAFQTKQPRYLKHLINHHLFTYWGLLNLPSWTALVQDTHSSGSVTTEAVWYIQDCSPPLLISTLEARVTVLK